MIRSVRTPEFFLVLGAFLYWFSLPPLNVWPCVFLVPVCWTVVVVHPGSIRFRWTWLTGLVFWLASIWWIACPHPLTAVGLLALSAFLALYWTMFFAASRVALHRFHFPAVLTLPLCWMGCEFLRKHLLGGFSFCSLEHALYRKPSLIQIADIGGETLVGGMIMLVGSGVGVMLVHALELISSGKEEPDEAVAPPKKKSALPPGSLSALLGMGVLLLCSWYGMSGSVMFVIKPREIRVATLQGNIPVRLDMSADQMDETFYQFNRLSYDSARQARKDGNPLELIIWPETVCPINVLEFRNGAKPEDVNLTEEEAARWQGQLQGLTDGIGVPILFGLSTFVLEKADVPPKRLNSALLVYPQTTKPQQSPADWPRYDKVHLVMFGEYIPFSSWLPDDFFIKTLCQEAGRGTAPVAMPLYPGTKNGDDLAVNICFESSVPHLVRDQVLTLRARGNNPRILVNMSNDGWFRFSQQIDQHLATHVFRAVENRLPCVTATNGGFSAVIDDRGRIQAIGTRRAAEAVIGEVSLLSEGRTIYHIIGDTPTLICAILVILLLCCRIPCTVNILGNRRAF